MSKAAAASSGSLNSKLLVAATEAIRKAMEDLNDLNANGVFNDKEQKKQQALQKKIGELKQTLAEKLSGNPTGNVTSTVSPGRRKSISTIVAVADEDHRVVLEDFFESVIQDTDNKPGNLPLMRAFVNFVALDFPALCESRGLMSTCAVDGSLGFLEAFLSDPQGARMQFDTEELIASAMYSQQYRIPLMSLLLKHEAKLRLDKPETIEAIKESWNEFISDIASKKKAIAREDRGGQKQLVEKMIAHSTIPFNVLREGGDGLTLFSRACLEADLALVEYCVQKRLCPPVNHLNGDGSTALMQAVVGNNTAIVKLLLGMADVDVNIEGPNGTALQIASLLKRDPAIVLALKGHLIGSHSPPTSTSPAEVLDNSRGLVAPAQTPSSRRSSTTTSPAPAPRAASKLPSLAGKLPGSSVARPSPPVKPIVAPKKGLAKMQLDPPRNPVTPPPRNVIVSDAKPIVEELRSTTSPTTKSPRTPEADHPTEKNPRTAVSITPQPVDTLPPLQLQKSPSSSPQRVLEPPPALSAYVSSNTTKQLEEGTTSGVLKQSSGLVPQHSSSDVRPLESPSSLGDIMSYAAHTAQTVAVSPRVTRQPQVLLDDSSTTTTREISLSASRKVASTRSLKRSESEASLFSQESQYSLLSMGSIMTMPRGSSCVASHRESDGPLGGGAAMQILDMVREVCSERQDNQHRASMGVFTDDEFSTQDSSALQQLESKARIAYELRKHFSKTKRLRLSIDSTDEEEWVAFFVSCVQDSDADSSNEDVVLAMMDTLDLDFAYVIREHSLIEAAAADGSVTFLSALLAVPSVKVDLAEVLPYCMFNPQFRIPLTITLLKALSKSQLLMIKSELWSEYQECFSDICSMRKEIPGEDRSRRLELIELMVTNQILKIDPRTEANDGQTALSRAAHEGDEELIKLFVKHRFFHNPNDVLPDGSTALVHAVFGRNVQIVKSILSITGANVNFTAPSSGSAFSVAKNLGLGDIVDEMRLHHGADDDLCGASGIYQVPELPLLESSNLEASMKSMTLLHGTLGRHRQNKKLPCA